MVWSLCKDFTSSINEIINLSFFKLFNIAWLSLPPPQSIILFKSRSFAKFKIALAVIKLRVAAPSFGFNLLNSERLKSEVS